MAADDYRCPESCLSPNHQARSFVMQKSKVFRQRKGVSGRAGDAPIADVEWARQIARMGKRSSIPHTDDELDKLTGEELQAELDRSRSRLAITPSAKVAKQWDKRIRWIEPAIGRRT